MPQLIELLDKNKLYLESDGKCLSCPALNLRVYSFANGYGVYVNELNSNFLSLSDLLYYVESLILVRNL